MQLSGEQLEQIVNTVIARVRNNVLPNNESIPVTSAATVVTLEIIERIPASVNSLQISSKAVITPLAQDELRSRNIRIVRGCKTPEVIANWFESCIKDDGELTSARLLGRIRQGVETNYPVIVSSTRPHWCVCELNRSKDISATIVQGPECLESLFGQLNANVLIVDSNQIDSATLKSIGRLARSLSAANSLNSSNARNGGMK